MSEHAARELRRYPLIRSGKVRDLYELDGEVMIVSSDRVSAFDVVLPDTIPDKGKLLTGISRYWFARTASIVPNFVRTYSIDDLDLDDRERTWLEGRTVIGSIAERIDIECVVRGYLAGTGFKEYAKSGTLAGRALPAGLVKGARLPEVQFTPAIKNDIGHDENISTERLKDIVGEDLAGQLEAISMQLYATAAEHAAIAGFVLADTKFEFGWIDGQLHVIDEMFTPDSSRYWLIDNTVPGEEPPAYDKQPIRDWLETQPWDKAPPGPHLPKHIIDETATRYAFVLERLQASDRRKGDT